MIREITDVRQNSGYLIMDKVDDMPPGQAISCIANGAANHDTDANWQVSRPSRDACENTTA